MRLIDADKLEPDGDLTSPTAEAELIRYERWVYDDETGIWKCILCSRAAISSGYGQELSEHCPKCSTRMIEG